MDMNQMRTYISQHPKYRNSQKWRDKVLNMSDNQVIAVYNKFKALDYRKIEKEMEENQ